MSRVKSVDTVPELLVRSLLHRAGYRFRLHVKGLPGKPDIVLPKYKTVIEIRGCFWHHHENCSRAGFPKTRKEWWKEKLEKNVYRDNENVKALLSSGWKVILIWDCLFKNAKHSQMEQIKLWVITSLRMFLEQGAGVAELSFDVFRRVQRSF